MYEAKIKDDPLFDLIKSLTQTEAAFFKKYACIHVKGEENNYVQLYDILDGMEYFDDSALRKQLGKKNVPKQLHRVKNYLYNQILSSLREYHAAITIEEQLKDTLKDIEIMYGKGNYKLCKTLLDNGKALGYKYEKLNAIIEFLEWDTKLISKDIGYKNKTELLSNIFLAHKLVLDQKKNLYEYELWFNKMYTVIKSNNKIRDVKQLAAWEEIMGQDIFKEESKALSFQAKIIYNYCWGGFYYCTGNWKKVLEVVKRRYDLLESRQDLINDAPHQYINILGNKLGLLVNLPTMQSISLQEGEAQFFEIVKSMKRFGRLWRSLTGISEIEIRVFANTTIHELGFYVSRGDFISAMSCSEKAEEKMESLVHSIGRSSELAYLYYTAYAYFGAGEYRRALRYINYIMNNNYLELREDMQCFTRILNLMVHYELGNVFVLESGVLHAKRFLKQKGYFFAYEKCLLVFFKKAAMLKLDTRKEEAKALLSLKNGLKAVPHNKYTNNFDEYFHFMWWIESKLAHKPFAEMVQEGVAGFVEKSKA